MIANKLRSGSNQPTKEYTASGALANGDLVILNADNTVSVCGMVSSINNPPTAVSSVTFDATTYAPSDLASVYDSNSNKVVVMYVDWENGNKGTAVVGSISGTTISFGTPVVYNSDGGSWNPAACFDTTANKVIVIYRDANNSNYIKARVGTVSGTSTSWGSTTGIYTSGNSAYLGLAYDDNADRTVFIYRSYSNNYGYARVGQLSGTSFTLGSATVYSSANRTDRSGIVYDSYANKVVIAYMDEASADKGKAIVGSVSGTSISFGSAVQFTSNFKQTPGMAFDTTDNKVIIFYEHYNAGSHYFRAVVGTISGSSISFGSECAVFSSGANRQYITASYDSGADRTLVAFSSSATNQTTIYSGTVSGSSISFGSVLTMYATSGDSAARYPLSLVFDASSSTHALSFGDYVDGDGQTVVISVGSTTANLTASNFVGISNGAYSNAATATIQMNRATDNAQSGLTAGSTYYAQTDGTLSTTADSPSVLVGAARTTTSIKIKGSNA
jgi:hypothetical protein